MELNKPGFTWVFKNRVGNRICLGRNILALLDLTVTFHHEHSIVPTSCPWVSEDAPGLVSRPN